MDQNDDVADLTRTWLPVLFRALVLWQLFWPAFSKFLVYDQRVVDFTHHGVANPGVWVPIVGFFEVLTILGVGLGILPRLAAVPGIIIMVIAITLVGPEFANIAVLVGCLGVLALGAGPLAVWPHDEGWLRRLRSPSAPGNGATSPRRPWSADD